MESDSILYKIPSSRDVNTFEVFLSSSDGKMFIYTIKGAVPNGEPFQKNYISKMLFPTKLTKNIMVLTFC